MTSTEIDQYFQFHNSNMKLLKIGFEEIRDQIKTLHLKRNKSNDLIYDLDNSNFEKREIRKKEKSLSRILSGVQVSWAEESIKRLFYEKDLLTDAQRNYLLELPLDQKWYKTLKIVFCIAYDLVPVDDEICDTINIQRERRNLGNEIVSNYSELKEIITSYLVPNFSIRNKVQHGEWEYAFKPKYSKEYSVELTSMLNDENIVTTTSRFNLVNTFYHMIVDLGRFKSNSFALDSIMTPFEYFYQKNSLKIKFEINKIKEPKIDEFISLRISKEKKGSEYRLKNSQL